MNIKAFNTPRWLIFLIDLLICLFSIILAFQLRFNFSIPQPEVDRMPQVLVFVLGVRAISFVIFRLYAGIIRYTSTRDAMRILGTIGVGSIVFAAGNFVYFNYNSIYLIPFGIIIIDYLVTVFIMTTARLMVKVAYLEMRSPRSSRTNVLIFGAGEAGLITKRSLDRDVAMAYRVVGFIDDDPKKTKKKLEGVTIYSGKKDMLKLFSNKHASHLIISVQNVDLERKREIIELCLANDISVLNVPPYNSWINGELSVTQLKKIRIEDLLERAPIKLDIKKIKFELTNKRVLISGAAGSIGSEIVRQVLKFDPELLILLDQAESPLYDLEMEIRDKFPRAKIEIVIGDICNEKRMNMLFELFKPEIVFHAAAYKHVPLMEMNPAEAIQNNITGTRILVDLAKLHLVNKFVMISTDKAVNPTNIMGASKRIAEIYAQCMDAEGSTRFITTRFGNVLGSNGSVIPRFKKQIDAGGPVTVTHPEITRYFMTIPEACQLVLEAGALGKGGEIFIFDMGESVKIVGLAEKMIKLSGLEPGKDIQIVFTGLRPGEKLYEELLNDSENTLPTHHPKIMIAQVRTYEKEKIVADLNELAEMPGRADNNMMVKKMKMIVPEFISRNSVFEELDTKI